MSSKFIISSNKIIILIVFIATALITSLFIFHKSQHKASITLADSHGNNNGMLFPVARELKPFELISADNASFTPKNLRNHWTLLFFGFTHCSNVCPTTLAMLNLAYGKLHDNYPNLQIVLISLDPDRDTQAALAKYIHSFNPNFIGASGKIQELHKLQSQLGIFSARDNNTTDSNYQLQHTATIMLINPQGQWAGLFRFGMNPEQFASAFTTAVNQMNIFR